MKPLFYTILYLHILDTIPNYLHERTTGAALLAYGILIEQSRC